MKKLNNLNYFFKKVYRVIISSEKQQEIVWKDLINLHKHYKWKSGVFENDKYIETTFNLSSDTYANFYYMIYDGHYHCKVNILQSYPPELTSDIFVLAAHFNNILNRGKVTVNVKESAVRFVINTDILVPLLYSGVLYSQLIKHYKISKDIYAAYQRLIVEGESPAIIIADLLREKDEEKDKE